MKFNSEKDRHSDLPVYIISLLLVAVILFTGSADKITLAMASAVFYAGKIPETSVETAKQVSAIPVSEKETVSAETEKVIPVENESDITQTPDDIVALIEKYTKLFSNDKKDGEIKAVTYEKAGATHIFENVRVKNTTETKTLNIEKSLSQPLGLSVDKSKPAVLIFHSHTSEGYEMIERDWYAQDYTSRSNDENRNIVRVGTEIANYLTKLGYTVIHDKTIHDKNYSDSYPNSRKTVEKHLKEHPEIQIVLDIHRDSITQNNGVKIKPVNTIGGKKAAQLMIITGAEEGKVKDFPDWEYNLSFALQLQKKCETMFPGLMRPVLFSQRKYNMDMTHFSLLIEMGSEANTLEEACYSGRMLAAALASLMDDYLKEE
ncbi:MAG: stage II sporulation protein P [Clostridia bacterium]|nr:stage II sporulation protein P [Clostridia bacterium]